MNISFINISAVVDVSVGVVHFVCADVDDEPVVSALVLVAEDDVLFVIVLADGPVLLLFVVVLLVLLLLWLDDDDDDGMVFKMVREFGGEVVVDDVWWVLLVLNSDIKVALANGDVGVVVVEVLWPILLELVLVPDKPNKLLPEFRAVVVGFCSVMLKVSLSPPWQTMFVLAIFKLCYTNTQACHNVL